MIFVMLLPHECAQVPLLPKYIYKIFKYGFSMNYLNVLSQAGQEYDNPSK